MPTRFTCALVAAACLAGCGSGGRDPRPLAPPTTAEAPFVQQAPPSLRNALGGLTFAPLRVRVQRAVLTPGYAWLHVKDDIGELSWVAAPALAATPTDVVTLHDYVVSDAAGFPLSDVVVDKLLVASDIVGPDVQLAPSGDDAVLDPLLPPVELTGTAAIAEVPVEHEGATIAALRQRAADLAGTTVRVRGQVMRVIPRVMGLQWLWLRDGSAAGNADRLLVAVRQPVEPGVVIDVEGVLTVDRALGGRTIGVVIEPARILLPQDKAAKVPATRPAPTREAR